MYRVIAGSRDHTLESLNEVVEWYYTESDFDYFLDETNEPINIFDEEYLFSYILLSSDAERYKQEYRNKCRELEESLRKELEEDGSAYFYNGAHVFDLDKYKEEEE